MARSTTYQRPAPYPVRRAAAGPGNAIRRRPRSMPGRKARIPRPLPGGGRGGSAMRRSGTGGGRGIVSRPRAGGFKAAGDPLGTINTSGAKWLTHRAVSEVRSHKPKMTLNGIMVGGKNLRF